MADKNIGSLPAAQTVDDDSLLVAEQQGQAVKVSGAQFKGFARAAVSQFVDAAKGHADAAAKSAADAAASVGQIQDSVTRAETAAGKAEASATTAQNAQTAVESAAASAEQSKIAAETAAATAAEAKTGADAARSAAEAAAAQASADKGAAETARAEAQAAQAAAETAKNAAETASTNAAGKAEEAAQSAATAKEYSGKPPLVQNGNWWTWDAENQQYRDTGKRAVLGFDKVYTSVAEMEADKTNQPDNTVAIISTEINEADNAKLYIKNGANWDFLSDLSGFTGVGVQSFELTSGNHAPGTTDTYTITLTDGRKQTISVYNGADGQGAGDFMASGSVPMTGDLKMGGNRIVNVGAPVEDTDAVRKSDLDEAVNNVKVTTDAAPTEGSTNPVQSGGVFTALSQKQDHITGVQGQVVGFDAAGKPVAQAAPSGLPDGGTAGQVLTKGEGSSAVWADAPDTADAIKVPGGGSATVPPSLAVGPYTFEFTEDQEGSGGGMSQEAADERYLQLSGGTMTGPLLLSGAPTQDLHPATKAYADSKSAEAANAGTAAAASALNDAKKYTDAAIQTAVTAALEASY